MFATGDTGKGELRIYFRVLRREPVVDTSIKKPFFPIPRVYRGNNIFLINL